MKLESLRRAPNFHITASSNMEVNFCLFQLFWPLQHSGFSMHPIERVKYRHSMHYQVRFMFKISVQIMGYSKIPVKVTACKEGKAEYCNLTEVVVLARRMMSFEMSLKVAGNPAFSRSTNLESKLIEFFVFVNF